GPNDEQKWVTWALDEIKPVVLDLLDGADTIIIGRKLAVDYIPYWEGVVKNPDDAMYDIGKYIVNAHKIIFTKTMDKSGWSNTDLAKGNLTDEIRMLKSQKGKDILVYGGSSFVTALVKERLIDEFKFFLNPVAIGKGDGIFSELESFQQLKLTKSVVYPSGIVLLQYVPVSA
ncbi:MAG TPA: dihydrofolate reductase family protein, partial [Chitinophagaceae bacterium]